MHKWYVKRRKKENKKNMPLCLFYSKNVDYCRLWFLRTTSPNCIFFSNMKTTMSVTKSTVTLIRLLAMHIALSFNYIRTTYTYSYSGTPAFKVVFLVAKKKKLKLLKGFSTGKFFIKDKHFISEQFSSVCVLQ